MNTSPLKKYIPSFLVVEDDLDDQMLLKSAFDQTKKEVSIHFVSIANEALEFLQQTPDHLLPDLILLDFKLPGLDGERLKQQLNTIERYAAINKVILSQSCCSSSLTARTEQCFAKPESFEGMVQLAEELLRLCDTRVM